MYDLQKLQEQLTDAVIANTAKTIKLLGNRMRECSYISDDALNSYYRYRTEAIKNSNERLTQISKLITDIQNDAT
jgi:hypothetical protein